MDAKKKTQKVHIYDTDRGWGQKGATPCGVGVNRAAWTYTPEEVTCPACLKKMAQK